MGSAIERSRSVRAAELRLCSDGVIEIELRQGVRMDADEVAELLRAQRELSPRFALVLVDARGVVSMTRKALGTAAHEHEQDSTAAVALLVNNPVSVMLANFFIRYSRPPFPARLFREPDAARIWLRNHQR